MAKGNKNIIKFKTADQLNKETIKFQMSDFVDKGNFILMVTYEEDTQSYNLITNLSMEDNRTFLRGMLSEADSILHELAYVDE